MATTSGTPDAEDVLEYLDGTSYTAEQAGTALAAEMAAQAHICRVPAEPADLPDDLREALLRRCAVNLARRRYLLEAPAGDTDFAPPLPPGRDPEVRRFEAAHRKLVFG